MRRSSVLIGAVIVTLAAGTCRGEVLLGVQAGGGYLRFGELEDFWNEVGLSHDSDDLAFQWEVSATWRLAPRHALRLSVERITSSVTVYFADRLTGAFLYADLDFETIPVCIGYEFALRRSEHGALTLAGLGVGYYASELESEEVYADPSLPYSRHDVRDGDGYGFHGYLRQTAPVSNRLSLSGMIRGRWADAMAFEDIEDAIDVDFTDFDFSVGLEWKI